MQERWLAGKDIIGVECILKKREIERKFAKNDGATMLGKVVGICSSILRASGGIEQFDVKFGIV